MIGMIIVRTFNAINKFNKKAEEFGHLEEEQSIYL